MGGGGDWARSLVLLGNSLKVCGDISDCHRDGPGFCWHLVGGDQRTMVFCTGHLESVPPTVPQVGRHPVVVTWAMNLTLLCMLHFKHLLHGCTEFSRRQAPPQWKKAYIDTLLSL